MWRYLLQTHGCFYTVLFEAWKVTGLRMWFSALPFTHKDFSQFPESHDDIKHQRNVVVTLLDFFPDAFSESDEPQPSLALKGARKSFVQGKAACAS